MKRTNLRGRLATAVIGLAIGVLVGAAYLVGCGATTKAAPAPQPVYTATFDGQTINLYLVNGLYQGSALVNGDTLDVVFSPWFNAANLNLLDPADWSKLEDRVRVNQVKAMAVGKWVYEGPALASFDLQTPVLVGASYDCPQTVPVSEIERKATCVITRID